MRLPAHSLVLAKPFRVSRLTQFLIAGVRTRCFVGVPPRPKIEGHLLIEENVEEWNGMDTSGAYHLPEGTGWDDR